MRLFTLALLFLLFLLVQPIFAFQPVFDTRLDYSVDGAITSTVVGDFNDDGIIDIVCGNASNNASYLKLFHGRGNGTFYPPIDVYGGVRQYYMGAGDFNSDGKIDFATITQPYYWNLNIIMNNGDGTYSFSTLPGNISYPIHTGDMDFDGDDDIIIDAGTNVKIAFSNGDGTFGEGGSQTQVISDSIYYGLIVADLNGDNYPDIVKAGTMYLDPDFTPAIRTYINNGDSTFQPGAVTYWGTTSDKFRDVALGHFNSDVYIDLAFSDMTGLMGIMTGNADGTFTLVSTFTPDMPGSFAVGNINGDDFDDIVFTHESNNSISVMINNGLDDATFGTQIHYSGKIGANLIWAHDINNDGLDDILTGSWDLSVFLNHGNGTFPSLEYNDQLGNNAFGITTADFNLDLVQDIVTIDSTAVYVGYNNGSGSFVTIDTVIMSGNRYAVAPGQFGGDEALDFVVGGMTIMIYHGNTTGGFTLGSELTDLWGWNVVADYFNADNDLDIATAAWGNNCLFVKLSDGAGSYLPASSYNPATISTSAVTAICAARIDSNASVDIVLGSKEKKIIVNFNDGNGGFGTFDEYPISDFVWAVIAVDLNNDGYNDIAAAAHTNIAVLINNGDGTFASPVYYASGPYGTQINDIVSSDVDGDGDPDLAAVDKSLHSVSVILNAGDGTFTGNSRYAAGIRPTKIAMADLNGDMHNDLAILNNSAPGENHVTFLFNNGLAVGDCTGPNDFDNDGIPDLCDNCPHSANSAQVDTDDNGVGDSCQFITATPIGSQVVVNAGLGVTITFDSIDVAGNTEISAGLGDIPAEAFRIAPLESPNVLMISTDAVFISPIQVCLQYSVEFINGLNEYELALLHYDNGQWVDVTVTLDTAANVICGSTNSLSPFALGVPGVGTGVDDEEWIILPLNLTLAQNYPNPFNPSTTIEYNLTRRSFVSIEIFNVLGQKVRSLVGREESAGSYSITWDGTDGSGKTVATGVYLYRLQAGDHIETKKMLLLK